MSSTDNGAVYMPPDDMNTTEAPSALRSSGSSRSVIRCGPSTWQASWVS